jgi:hypothetical protein
MLRAALRLHEASRIPSNWLHLGKRTPRIGAGHSIDAAFFHKGASEDKRIIT